MMVWSAVGSPFSQDALNSFHLLEYFGSNAEALNRRRNVAVGFPVAGFTVVTPVGAAVVLGMTSLHSLFGLACSTHLLFVISWRLLTQ
jgi:hypothetical protein